ncbi:Thymidylate synthase [Cupriavidus taiwanensis]|uniref:thymidylate synthase n=1 Tax=Cupriavidus taiwanensis TaxID=164546 RepID=UPI000E1A678D|nr:thymidylate synthase [Cupriavidus taiwanensis]SOZ24681.1 Thymidylate synthase [Cupriavidus taiwanensis]
MYLTAETIDDLLRKVYGRLLRKRGSGEINPTKGPATEINGALLLLKNPRARLSQSERKNTLFSCLGEFLWYLAGSDKLDFIQYYISRYKDYSDDGITVFGAYGPRLFGPTSGTDQVQNVIRTLRASEPSRRAVIQLFHGDDLAANLVSRREDLPCTCTLQFTIRNHQLHAMVMMRSNDAFMGLPHDIFAFTMLQELIARSLGVEIGQYKHAVGSLHLYANNTQAVHDYLAEGFQESVSMPPMPTGDPWSAVTKLLKAERTIKRGKQPTLGDIDPYWADLVRLLQVFRYSRDNARQAQRNKVDGIKERMTTNVYDVHILKRQLRAPVAAPTAEQLLFDTAELDAQQPASGDSNQR